MIRSKHTDDNDDKNPQEVISSHPDAITLFAVLLLALLLAPATIPGQVGINASDHLHTSQGTRMYIL